MTTSRMTYQSPLMCGLWQNFTQDNHSVNVIYTITNVLAKLKLDLD